MITIVLRQVGLSNNGPRYEATLDGEVLVASARDPEHEAARAMQARGLTGPFRTTDATGRARMTYASIEGAAKLTIFDPPSSGLRLRKWLPMPTRGDQNGVHFGDRLPGSGEENNALASGPRHGED